QLVPHRRAPLGVELALSREDQRVDRGVRESAEVRSALRVPDLLGIALDRRLPAERDRVVVASSPPLADRSALERRELQPDPGLREVLLVLRQEAARRLVVRVDEDLDLERRAVLRALAVLRDLPARLVE